jgi:hypothetical protein
MDKPSPIEIGYINACIDGDRRYSSRLSVQVEGDKAHVILTENGATGGMDGPGGSDPFRETKRTTVEKNSTDIVKAIKATMDDTIKRYGKPSKRFLWPGVSEPGLSTARCKQALEFLKDV